MVAAISRSQRTCFYGVPIFATGFWPVDSFTRSAVVACSCPVEVDGVVVNPSDIIFGDSVEIVILPDRL